MFLEPLTRGLRPPDPPRLAAGSIYVIPLCRPSSPIEKSFKNNISIGDNGRVFNSPMLADNKKFSKYYYIRRHNWHCKYGSPIFFWLARRQLCRRLTFLFQKVHIVGDITGELNFGIYVAYSRLLRV